MSETTMPVEAAPVEATPINAAVQAGTKRGEAPESVTRPPGPGGPSADPNSAAPATTGHPVRTFIVVAVAMFMAQLDNLVVTSALPSIQKSLHAGLQGLQWTVSAYTLTFAVFLLTGSTLGDRFGRTRLFTIGL